MEFEKGSKVEVMNKTEGATSWCVAEVVSGNKDSCNLRYDCCVNISKVSWEFIRPCPPHANDWVVGDIVEMLDHSCSWKTATLVHKVSDGVHFSLRPHGFTCQIIAHESNIRARQVWKHGKWFPFLEDSGDLNVAKKNLLDAAISSTKRASPFCSNESNASSNKKLKDYDEEGVGNDNFSVGSCSNSPYEAHLDSSSGAESSNTETDKQRQEEENMRVIHGLELHAYHSTLEALYASGPLTWDKEALLTNLRINLHISNDEHLIHIRNLISNH